jgi:hypothetical protein
MSGAKLYRNLSIAATVALLLTPLRPLALLPAFFAFHQQNKLGDVNRQIGYEVKRYKALPPPVEAPKPPPTPLI